MVQLLLILIGARVLRRRWWLLGLLGLAWFAFGTFFFVTAFIEERRIPMVYFVVPLAVDGVLSLIGAIASGGARRSLRFAKAGLFVAIAVLLLGAPNHGAIVIGFLVGTYLVVDGVWRGASAYVVRFSGWRISLFNAGIEVLLGLWSYLPWPTYWQGEVASDIGMLFMVEGFGVYALAMRIARLPEGAGIAEALSRRTAPRVVHRPENAAPREGDDQAAAGDVTVHVWTPTGGLAGINRGVARYVAALDEKGVVSTGHAAMEGPGFYVSHYPAVEIDRSGSDFRRTLRATTENDVPGRFLPGYREESEGWCASTMQVRMQGLDAAALRRFWRDYSADTTYNLTNRNCSSAVAATLDAGLEGLFARDVRSPWFLIRLMLSPELWIAGQMRHRAAAMAWTPGIVLDYARALSYLVDLPARLDPSRAGRAGRAAP